MIVVAIILGLFGAFWLGWMFGYVFGQRNVYRLWNQDLEFQKALRDLPAVTGAPERRYWK